MGDDRDGSGKGNGSDNVGYNFGEEARPDRALTARRRAEQRWRLTEPWRVQEKHRRWRKIAIVAVLLIGVGVALDLNYSGSPLPQRDIAGVTDTGGQLRFLYYGCSGQRLVSVIIYHSQSTLSNTPANTLWWAQSDSSADGNGQYDVAFGTAPPGFHDEVSFDGVPDGGNTTLYIEAQTNEQLISFAFSPAIASGGYVITATGRMPLAQYQQSGQKLCS